MSRRIDEVKPDLFIDSPGEFLVKQICLELSKVEEWRELFADAIEPYMREDFNVFAPPALRVYCLGYTKESDSGFINGNITADILLPASTRREQQEQYADTISTALLQQFRRPTWFQTLADLVPGLNQLGTIFDVDKGLVFQWEQEQLPLVAIRINFRLDLRVWDEYLMSTSRTKDDPFNVTLGNLRRIAAEIRGLREETTEVTIKTDQKKIGDEVAT